MKPTWTVNVLTDKDTEIYEVSVVRADYLEGQTQVGGYCGKKHLIATNSNAELILRRDLCPCLPNVLEMDSLVLAAENFKQDLLGESSSVDNAKERLLQFIPYLRHSVKRIETEQKGNDGKVMLGVLWVNPDGSGKIENQFDHQEFFKDLELLVSAPPQTEQDDMKAMANDFVTRLGLKRGDIKSSPVNLEP